jgi:hypothetical protein
MTTIGLGVTMILMMILMMTTMLMIFMMSINDEDY